MGIDIETSVSGPLFDGRAEAALKDYTHAVAHDLGEQGERMVRDTLHAVERHPTGFYESHTNVRYNGGIVIVNDGGVVYGPWLEGTGSRNRTTRFKGYGTYRKVTEQLKAKVTEVAEATLRRFIGRMN